MERQERIFKEERQEFENKIEDMEQLVQQLHKDYQEQLAKKDDQIHRLVDENRDVEKKVEQMSKEAACKKSGRSKGR